MLSWFHEVSRIAPIVILIIYAVQFLETRKLEEIRDENFGENQKEFEINLLQTAYQDPGIELPKSFQSQRKVPEAQQINLNLQEQNDPPAYQDFGDFQRLVHFNQNPIEQKTVPEKIQPVSNFQPESKFEAPTSSDFRNKIPTLQNSVINNERPIFDPPMESGFKPRTPQEMPASNSAAVSTSDFKFPGNTRAPNKRKIFFNRLPKSGATSLRYIFERLANTNKFVFDYQKASMFDCAPGNKNCQDGPSAQAKFGVYIRRTHWDTKDENYLMMKQHHFFNFTEFKIPQPTYLNMVRDPVSRLASSYYFQRHGWGFGSNSSNKFKGSQEDFNRSFDDCVKQGLAECSVPLQVFSKYFCGTSEACKKQKEDSKDDLLNKIAVSAQIAKRNILNEYFFIGLLEHFDDTLFLLEKILPDYFRGAALVARTKAYQEYRMKSASKKQATFTNATRSILENGVLRYETDIYKLIQKLFYERLQYFKK